MNSRKALAVFFLATLVGFPVGLVAAQPVGIRPLGVDGKPLNLDLLSDPEVALQPDPAAGILAEFFIPEPGRCCCRAARLGRMSAAGCKADTMG